jgi:NADP-dependent 3-hydroxy acid dehydrogenase YdfG
MTDFPTPNNSCDLSGQVALVTGTTSGLGWRFASVLAKAGAKVALTGRRTERLEQLAKQIRADGGECACIRLDMTDMEDVVLARPEGCRASDRAETLRNARSRILGCSRLGRWPGRERHDPDGRATT